jgi:transcriptional regulator with XRE-family HTH domain
MSALTSARTPTVGRRRLRMALRDARDAAGLTQDQVATQMDWSLSKVIRIEAGSVGISTNDLKALLRLYGVTDEAEAQEFLDLARVARRRAWWNEYKEVLPPKFLEFIGLEADAHVHRNFQSVAVPGLLQTRAYAEAVVVGTAPHDLDRETVERIVAVRLRRRTGVLDRDDPPHILAILDESVIRRIVGSPAVMREQLDFLVECAARPNVTVRVLPFSAGPHPVMAGASLILEFPGTGDGQVLYVENAMTGDILEQRKEMGTYDRAFARLEQLALDPAASVALIEQVAAELA